MFNKKRALPIGAVILSILAIVGIWSYVNHVNYSGNDATSDQTVIHPQYEYAPSEDTKDFTNQNTGDKNGGAVKQEANTESSETVQSSAPASNTGGTDSVAVDRAQQEWAAQQAAFEEQQRVQTCNLLTTNYPIYTNLENSIHQQKINSINSYHQGRGTFGWGVYQVDIDAENSRHQQRLDSLQSEYGSQVVQSHC